VERKGMVARKVARMVFANNKLIEKKAIEN
jgi:hypothetical protein